MSIEDKKFPKDNSLLEGGRQDLAPIEEFVGRSRQPRTTRRARSYGHCKGSRP